MSQSRAGPQEISLSNNRSIHLSKNNQVKNELFRKIDLYINQLRMNEEDQDKIELLTLRKKLIGKYGLSIERIDNLERIFLHYCSHIFKTGKHMTFERLQYEKNHLTMDRFFAFLKDFGLTAAIVDGVSRQILQKSELVLLFKKISVNCKDLDFQQFISGLQRIGILYYDSKMGFREKQVKLALQRKKRKEAYDRSIKRKQVALEAHSRMKNEEDGDKLAINQNGDQEEVEGEVEEGGNEENNENDKIVTEMMNDKSLEHPEEELKGEAGLRVERGEGGEGGEREGRENQDITPQQQQNEVTNVEEEMADQVDEPIPEEEPPKKEDFNREQLLVLTPEQKIEYFYELIDVDNSVTFKKKMRELNLPIFQSKGHSRRATSQVQISHKETNVRESRIPEITPEEKLRLEELRQVIEERKERNKNHGPHISKEDYDDRRRKRRMEEQQVLVKRLPRQKKVEVSELETDLSSLSKMEFDKINFRKFNPQKLYQPSQEDDAYLEEYYSVRRPQRSEKRIMSTLETTDKNSQILLDKLKKRAQEIQTRERMQESKYSTAQEVNSSVDHQLRKNRLLQKLLKLQKS